MIIVGFIFTSIETVLSRTIWPSLSLQVGNSKFTRGMLTVVIIGVISFWLVDRKLTSWESVSGAEKAYDTPRDRVLVWVYFASGFVSIALGIAFLNFLKNLFPMPH